MPKDNIGPLRINSRYPTINSGTASYLRYYICSVSNLILLFKTKCEKYQLQGYYMYFSLSTSVVGPTYSRIGIFLLMPLLTAVTLYL